ncbi:MAG: hypothetical protein ABIZ91_13870 [Gemmatimonadaceae bacterium]
MRRLVLVLLLGVAIYFAIQGGEYSTTDLFRQRTRGHMLRARIDSLGTAVDSLQKLKRRLATDVALQERVAREVNGMVRGDKELVYRFTDTAVVRVERK